MTFFLSSTVWFNRSVAHHSHIYKEKQPNFTTKQKVGMLGGDNAQQVVGGECFRSRQAGTGVKSTHSFARSNYLIQRLFAKKLFACSIWQNSF